MLLSEQNHPDALADSGDKEMDSAALVLAGLRDPSQLSRDRAVDSIARCSPSVIEELKW